MLILPARLIVYKPVRNRSRSLFLPPQAPRMTPFRPLRRRLTAPNIHPGTIHHQTLINTGVHVSRRVVNGMTVKRMTARSALSVTLLPDSRSAQPAVFLADIFDTQLFGTRRMTIDA